MEGGRLELSYEAHFLDDGTTVCGAGLSAQLIEDALRLMTAVEDNDLEKALERVLRVAREKANILSAELAEGKSAGRVLRL